MQPYRRTLEDDPCPVSDQVLAKLYRSSSQWALTELIAIALALANKLARTGRFSP